LPRARSMTIVLTTHGSTGDIYPMIRLGRALQDAGHRVRFATSEPFRGDIEGAGVPFFQIPPDWTREDLRHWMGRLQRKRSPVAQLKELYKAALPHIEAIVDGMDAALEGADCLVSSYLFPMNKAIADRRDVPFATYAFAHNTVPSRHYPPHGLPRLRGLPRPVQMSWNRLAWRLGNVVVDSAINATISRKLKRKGLPPVKDFFSKPAELVLVGVSPSLMRPSIKLSPRFQFVGYCRWQAPESAEAEAALRRFAEDEPVPILTFGSMVYDEPAAFMRRLLAHWPATRKLVVQPGWSGFKVPSGASHILEVGPMSHDQLFRHASLVIHHGGAGTTASALSAGKPHIVVPHIADQFFFSDEVIRLGCGLRLPKKRWPEGLAAAVAAIESDPAYARSARRSQALLQTEDGPAEAVRQIERLVERKGRPILAPSPVAAEAQDERAG